MLHGACYELFLKKSSPPNAKCSSLVLLKQPKNLRYIENISSFTISYITNFLKKRILNIVFKDHFNVKFAPWSANHRNFYIITLKMLLKYGTKSQLREAGCGGDSHSLLKDLNFIAFLTSRKLLHSKNPAVLFDLASSFFLRIENMKENIMQRNS